MAQCTRGSTVLELHDVDPLHARQPRLRRAAGGTRGPPGGPLRRPRPAPARAGLARLRGLQSADLRRPRQHAATECGAHDRDDAVPDPARAQGPPRGARGAAEARADGCRLPGRGGRHLARQRRRARERRRGRRRGARPAGGAVLRLLHAGRARVPGLEPAALHRAQRHAGQRDHRGGSPRPHDRRLGIDAVGPRGLAAAGPALGYIVVFGAVIAVLSWNTAVQRLGAPTAVLFNNLVPITAFAIAIAGGYSPNAYELGGAALAIARSLR